MQIAWYVVPLSVLALGVFYIGRRMLGPIRRSSRRVRNAWIALALWVLFIYASIMLGRIELPYSAPFSWLAYVSLGLLSCAFTALLIRDIIWLPVRAAAVVRKMITRARADENSVAADASRRAHLLQLTNVGVLGVAAMATSYGIYEARRVPGIVALNVALPGLHPGFEGFRIGMITDIHAGLTVGRDWVEMIASEVDRLDTDLIAFTGDLADGSVRALRYDVAPLAELRAAHGLFFVTGNHEYYSGAESWVKEVGRMGYDVLMNEHRIIERNGGRLVLGGITDYSAEQFVPTHKSDPERAMRDAPDNLVRILLAHQPKSLRTIGDVGFDLMLSGHTHGGQLFPWNLLTAADQPYLYGLHRHGPGQIYVSKGTGYWGPPVRLGARSEITVITLTAS